MSQTTLRAVKKISFSFYPITEKDFPFLFQVYASTRSEEMGMVPWTDEEKQQFLAMQFEAQHTHYMQHYPEANFDIINWHGKQIGRLYVDEWPAEVRIIDITLLPEYRNQGLGSFLLNGLMQRAAEGQKTLSIHVENNPAMRLYKRLGFQKVNSHGLYDLMEWKAI
ncbi:Ribosomal protein S18 acetylase RimI [Candidatus Electrothrix aarhusensis]|uniref:Ribosomal protein S18 acetylase RimI n=1 Tax=Candidatus Electrothrix aarhusensis TaxID=1859131 RepID=A0A3S4T7T9_9BACT|nr:Ribosomal protein S18 acetylase RimI [Candidatus Electrothrix aarhusensis]